MPYWRPALVAALWLSSATVAWADPPAPIDERDLRYQEKFQEIRREFAAFEKNIETALTASDKALDQRFGAQDKAVQAAFAASSQAVAAALQASKEAVNAAFSASSQAVAAALQAAKEAVEKAESANTKRFESVNEFRAQLRDQAATFLPRTEYESLKKAVEVNSSRLDVLSGAQLSLANSRTDSQGSWGIVVGVGGVLVGVIALVLSKRPTATKGR